MKKDREKKISGKDEETSVNYKAAMDLEIKYFDPTKMSKTASVLLIGRRGSGKSTTAEDIMSYQTHIKEGICISPTDNMTGFWSHHIPPLFIHHQYDYNITEEFLDHQDRKWRNYKRDCAKRGEEPEEGRVEQAFIICDDVTYDQSFFKNKSTRRLYMNGRHYSIFSLVTCQYLMDIGPDLRGQIDYVFILKETNRDTLEKMYKYFAGVFPSQAAFEETLRCCTENREAMVIDMTVQSYNISDSVFYYKATPRLEYKLGSEDYWKYGADNYMSEGDDEDDKEKIAEEYYKSGRSKKDQERAKQFRVTKQRPSAEAYRPQVASQYANAYRATTLTKSDVEREEAAEEEVPFVIKHESRAHPSHSSHKSEKREKKEKKQKKEKKEKRKKVEKQKEVRQKQRSSTGGSTATAYRIESIESVLA